MVRLREMPYAILGFIRHGEARGETLRERLRDLGFEQGRPGFYLMMGRIVLAGFATQRYESTAGRPGASSVYRITRKGIAALVATRDYYASVADFGAPF